MSKPDFTLGSTWEGAATPAALAAQTPEVADESVQLDRAVISKSCEGHYFLTAYLPGGIRVAGWLHERPLS